MDEQKIMKDKFERCGVCGKEYLQAVYNHRHGFYDNGHAPQNCPSCAYPFNFKLEVDKLVESNISVEISASGEVRFNTGDLASLVDKKLKEIWPKK